MKAREAAERLSRLQAYEHIGVDDKIALQIALEALRGNPCAVCVYQPPTAGDGRPCAYCPATAAVREETE